MSQDFAAYRQQLLDQARYSIDYGLEHGEPPTVEPEDFPQTLREQGACFVTLTLNGELRGCIGMLEAVRPLIVDVTENAFAAAFQDPRFRPVNRSEAGLLHLHISILHPAQAMTFQDRQDLLNQLRPGVDGLILADNHHRATFLPSVWESLPKPEDFLRHLLTKAGLSADHWSKALRAWRYTTESIE